MDLRTAKMPALLAITFLMALGGCASSEDGDDSDDIEDQPDAAPADDEGDDDDRSDDDTRPPARDAASSSEDDDPPRTPAKDASADPPRFRDAGAARDASATADAAAQSDAAAPTISDAASAPLFPDLFGDGGLLAPKIPGPPSPDNPKECPPVAPDNPIGPCIGVPVYATCTYGTYSCLCDWVHWLCI